MFTLKALLASSERPLRLGTFGSTPWGYLGPHPGDIWVHTMGTFRSTPWGRLGPHATNTTAGTRLGTFGSTPWGHLGPHTGDIWVHTLGTLWVHTQLTRQQAHPGYIWVHTLGIFGSTHGDIWVHTLVPHTTNTTAGTHWGHLCPQTGDIWVTPWGHLGPHTTNAAAGTRSRTQTRCKVHTIESDVQNFHHKRLRKVLSTLTVTCLLGWVGCALYKQQLLLHCFAVDVVNFCRCCCLFCF